MPTYGTYQRAKPRVRVRRGYTGNEPMQLSRSAAIATSVVIFSGQVISLNSSSQWILGCPAGKVPYIAFADSVDTDVVSSGKLLGLSCAGKYEIETAYYTTGGNFALDELPLIADTAGNVGNVALASGMNATADIIGMTSSGGLNNFGVISGVANSGTNSESSATSAVIFTTSWLPKRT